MKYLYLYLQIMAIGPWENTQKNHEAIHQAPEVNLGAGGCGGERDLVNDWRI